MLVCGIVSDIVEFNALQKEWVAIDVVTNQLVALHWVESNTLNDINIIRPPNLCVHEGYKLWGEITERHYTEGLCYNTVISLYMQVIFGVKICVVHACTAGKVRSLHSWVKYSWSSVQPHN